VNRTHFGKKTNLSAIYTNVKHNKIVMFLKDRHTCTLQCQSYVKNMSKFWILFGKEVTSIPQKIY